MAIEINLLQNKKNYKKLEAVFHHLRVAVVLLGFICVLTLVIVIALRQNAQASLSQERVRMENLQKKIRSLEDHEAQILLVQKKVQSMYEIIGTTPDYARHFETLMVFMPESTPSGRVDTMMFSDATATVGISFPNLNALTAFLQTVDSPEFQSAFKTIELSSITYSDPTKELVVNLNVGFEKTDN